MILLNDSKYIDKTYPAQTEVVPVSVEEWNKAKGHPFSAVMAPIVESGDAYAMRFPDGTHRYVMTSEVQ